MRWSLLVVSVLVLCFDVCLPESEKSREHASSSGTLPSSSPLSLQLQTGLGFVPPEPEGGGLERGVGQQRRQNPGHPQGEEPNQLSNALPCQVKRRLLWPRIWEVGLSLTCSSPVTRSALMSPKRAPTARPGRDRFTAESYTVLGKNTPAAADRLCSPMKLKYFKKPVDFST